QAQTKSNRSHNDSIQDGGFCVYLAFFDLKPIASARKVDVSIPCSALYDEPFIFLASVVQQRISAPSFELNSIPQEFRA
ncbi:MAG: hypothetical protein ABI618_09255, partial [Nitrospirota bacterium]